MIKLNFPPLDIFSQRQLDQIHNATLEVLERTGIRFTHSKALKIFKKSGAYVDEKTQNVRIPSYLVSHIAQPISSTLAFIPGESWASIGFTGFPGFKVN